VTVAMFAAALLVACVVRVALIVGPGGNALRAVERWINRNRNRWRSARRV